MITDNSFSKTWIEEKSGQHRNADKILLEKMIYALSLLEHLQSNGLDFIFKGGTSLTLLLPVIKRFSIDIDIILAPDNEEDLGMLFGKIIKNSRFTRFEENLRETKSQIKKAHFKFFYEPVTDTRSKEEYVLLDILYEENPYRYIHPKKIKNTFLEVEEPMNEVIIPSVEDILGDKLTAFAPDTTGIPYEKKGEGFEMEIIKQLYDLGNLFDEAKDMETIRQTFLKIAEIELTYRGLLDINVPQVLDNSFQTAFLLSLRSGSEDKFSRLQKGINKIKTFIFSQDYRIEQAIVSAAKVAYLASLIQSNETEIIHYDEDSPDNKNLIVKNAPPYNKLNKLKGGNSEAFFYWYHALHLRGI